MTVLQGALADRDAWSAVGHCPVEKTMAVLGTKSAMLIMREAYYGTTRFDDFARRVGITKAAAAARLSELVDAGLLDASGPTASRASAAATSTCSPMPAPTSCRWCGRCSSGAEALDRQPAAAGHLDCGAEATVEIRCAAPRATTGTWHRRARGSSRAFGARAETRSAARGTARAWPISSSTRERARPGSRTRRPP